MPGTFFLTGAFVDAFPTASRNIAASYPMGNHTQNHKDLTQLTTAGVQAEIRTGAASIQRVTGVNPQPYFRFPYGAVAARTIVHVGSNPDDGTTFDANALPRIIDEIRAQGYTLVTLEQVLPATP